MFLDYHEYSNIIPTISSVFAVLCANSCLCCCSLNQEVQTNGLLKARHRNISGSDFVLGFPGIPYSGPVPLLPWTASNLQKWRQEVWETSLSHILTPDMLSSKGESAQGLCWFSLPDELVSLLYWLSVFVEHEVRNSAADSACVQLSDICIMLSVHWSLPDPDFSVYPLQYLALREVKPILSFMLKNHFSAFHLNQVSIILCPHLLQK